MEFERLGLLGEHWVCVIEVTLLFLYLCNSQCFEHNLAAHFQKTIQWAQI